MDHPMIECWISNPCSNLLRVGCEKKNYDPKKIILKNQVKICTYELEFVEFPEINIYSCGQKGLTVHRTIVVKLPLLQAVWAGQGSILCFVIWIDFFLGPWLVVGQFIDISNQIEPTGEVANILQKKLYNAALYKNFL